MPISPRQRATYSLQEMENLTSQAWTIDLAAQQMYSTAGSVDQNPSTLTRRRRENSQEKEILARFIATGQTTNKFMGRDDNVIQMCGVRHDDSNKLFAMTSGHIIALKRRTRHLKSLLAELAEQEKRILMFTDNDRDVEVPNGRTISYFALRKRQQIDDTPLISLATPIPPEYLNAQRHVQDVTQEYYDPEQEVGYR